MEKQNATGSNPAVRVPPKIKIKALEAVKVCNLCHTAPDKTLVAAYDLLFTFALVLESCRPRRA